MMPAMRKIVFLMVLLPVCAGLLVWGCSKSQGVVAITKELADKLSSEFTFTNGTVVNKAPPAENPGSQYPQISKLVAQSAIKIGQSFSIQLDSSFSTPADVKGAVV